MAATSENHASAVQKLRAERDEIKAEAERVVNAIAAVGHSAMLLKRLADAEEKIAIIEARIEAHRPRM